MAFSFKKTFFCFFLYLFFSSLLQAAEQNSSYSSLNVPAAVSLFSSDGRPLRRYLSEDGMFREPVPLEQISPWAILAVLAAEDKRFFEHSGVDIKAIARAAAQNARAGRAVSGASTITQQLYRAYNPGPHTLGRKVYEAVSAIRLEQMRSKEEILQAYLNIIPYGNNLSGIQAASVSYFGVNASSLSLSQAAALAGVPRAPSLYNPVSRPEAFEKRRLSVLLKMFNEGYIDEESYRLAVAEKPTVRKPQQPFFAPHFSAWAASMAGERLSVRTTLVPEIQEAVQHALKHHISKLEKKHNMTNGAVIVIDNKTGGVLAWAGSKDFFDEKNGGQIDGVRTLRQPGSALKPFLYGLAFSRGHFPSELISDSPLYGRGGYSPLNYDRHNHGMVSLRSALACSYNIPAVRLAEEIGTESFLETLHSFGFESLRKNADHYGAGLALGNGEVTLLELANAYAALARGGIWKPVSFEKDSPSGIGRRALDEKSSFLINNVLSDNQARTPAFGEDSPLHMPFMLAAKTGTSKDYRDNWTIGYTPDWTVAVWVGNFDSSPMRRISGISGAAPLMRDIAMLMRRLYGSSDFKQPAGIEEMESCPLSGLPAAASCPSRIAEYYDKEHIPAKNCPISHESEFAYVSESKMSIEFPKDGDIYKIDPSYPIEAQALRFRSKDSLNDEWFIDGKKTAGDLWKLREGRHSLYFMRGKKKSSVIKFMVVR